jgi:flagellar capping protein FliD
VNSTDPDSVTLGCYVSPPARIFVYDITDARVADAEIVTAAHEMLHAVWYQDMTSADRTRIGNELQAWFDQLPSDHWLRDRLDVYADRPSSIPTELHSILGTEAANLTSSLENHYAKYFQDRSIVVGLSDGVNGKIRRLTEEIATIQAQLSELQPGLATRSENLATSNEQLTKDIEDFNAAVDAGEYNGRYSEYEADKEALDLRVEELRTQYAELSQDIDAYNALVADYNRKADEVNSLNASLSPQ